MQKKKREKKEKNKKEKKRKKERKKKGENNKNKRRASLIDCFRVKRGKNLGHFKKESDRFFATHDRPLTGDHSCVESEKNSRERQGAIVERFLDLGHFYFPDGDVFVEISERGRKATPRKGTTPVD